MEFILDPIYKLYAHSVGEETPELTKFLTSMNVFLSKKEHKLDVKPLMKLCFKKIFGNVLCLVDSIEKHLETPKKGT